MENFENNNVYENQAGGNTPFNQQNNNAGVHEQETVLVSDYENSRYNDSFQNNNASNATVEQPNVQQANQNNQQNVQNYQRYGQPNQQPNVMNNNQFNQYGQNYNQQNNQYGQQPYQYQNQTTVTNESGKNLGIASLVLGIVSFFCCGSVCSIIGFILGLVSRSKQKENNGMALAGIILSSIAFVIWAVYFIFVIVYAINHPDSSYSSNPYYYYY